MNEAKEVIPEGILQRFFETGVRPQLAINRFLFSSLCQFRSELGRHVWFFSNKEGGVGLILDEAGEAYKFIGNKLLYNIPAQDALDRTYWTCPVCGRDKQSADQKLCEMCQVKHKAYLERSRGPKPGDRGYDLLC